MNRGRPREFDREEALEKAMQVFWRNGYEATGLSELLSAMNIARQSLYCAFGDKRSLFLEAVRHYVETQSPHRLIVMLGAADSPLAGIRQTLEALVDVPSDQQVLGCLLCNASAEFGMRDPEIAQIVRDGLASIEEAFAQALRRAVDRGEVTQDLDVTSLARTLTTTIVGLSLLARLQVDREHRRDVVKSTLRLLG
ncbi:HTH-type transcriptional repressor ComR [Planctomycetes bacterium Pan216]|uniref:HTH-type transcriptional repressor ComR n=1 Tax=Kolteria novifilia TaxID=2527975 RepID=A0A518B8R2_9BACT|nr:HTH-type transcriptional repressor ComR [Planctomycetes bacterium Pan216]